MKRTILTGINNTHNDLADEIYESLKGYGVTESNAYWNSKSLPETHTLKNYPSKKISITSNNEIENGWENFENIWLTIYPGCQIEMYKSLDSRLDRRPDDSYGYDDVFSGCSSLDFSSAKDAASYLGLSFSEEDIEDLKYSVIDKLINDGYTFWVGGGYFIIYPDNELKTLSLKIAEEIMDGIRL